MALHCSKVARPKCALLAFAMLAWSCTVGAAGPELNVDAAPVGGDAGHDAGPSGADTGVADGGSCVPSTLFCAEGTRFICQPDGRVTEIPCPDATSCTGAGRCEMPCAGLADDTDLSCGVRFGTPLHTDVGAVLETPGDPGSALGADRFPFGLVLANVASEEIRFERRTVLSASLFEGRGHHVVSRTQAWDQLFAQTTARGRSRSAGTSAYIRRDGGGALRADRPFATWFLSPLHPSDHRFPGCREPQCLAASREGALISPMRGRGTRWVVVSRPVEAYWDSCESRVVVDGASFAYLAPASTLGRTVRVTLSAAVGDAVGPPDVTYDGLPGAAAGSTVDVHMEPGDAWQLVADGPHDEAECAPQTGPGCRHRCTHVADLTGTVIEATEPMLVLAGHECARGSDGEGTCGHLLEQIPADEWQGTHYVIPGPASYESAGASIRLVALEHETSVTVLPGGAARTLLPGTPQEIVLGPDGLALQGEAPFSVVRIAHGGAGPVPTTGARATPAMVFATPVSRWAVAHVVPRVDHTVAVVTAPRGAIIELDGALVTSAEHDLPGGEMTWREVQIPAGGTTARLATSAPASIEVAHVAPGSLVLASAARMRE